MLFAVGILLDAARIMAAERKVQSALNTAVRSVLAGCDANLAGEYGFFAVRDGGGGELEGEISKYFHVNLHERNKGFRLIDYRVDSLETRCFGGLYDNSTFKAQILDYMKYRMPIEGAQSIIEKFKASGFSSMLDFSQREKQARQKRNELKEKIETANETVRGLNSYSGSKDSASLKKVRESLLELKEDSSRVMELLEEYNNAQALALDSAESGVENGVGIQKAKENEFERTSSSSEKLKLQVEENIARVDMAIGSLDELERQLGELQVRYAQLEGKISGQDGGNNANAGSTGTADLENELLALNSEIEAKKTEIKLSEDSVSVGAMEELEYNEPVNDEREKPAENGSRDKLLELLESMNAGLGKYLKNITPDMLPDDGESRRERENDISGYSDMSLESHVYEEKIAEEKNNGILDFLQKISEALGAGAEKLFTTEYIMDKNTFLTSRTERGHFFEIGEVEYILWGDMNQLGNISKTAGSMWFLRFAVDTIDRFAASANPHPVFRLVYALGNGFLQSCSDMYNLCTGKQVGLCPSVNSIKLDYGDHLRIFLLLQSLADEEVQYDRLRQLMQINIRQYDESFSLKECNTVIHARSRVSVNLWFLHLLKLDRLGFENFEKGKFVIEKEVYQGY